jgi:hypothetical protein
MKLQTSVDPKLIYSIFVSSKRFICYTVQYGMVLLRDMKIVYHCFSCKKDFGDIDLAKEHSKSLHHELAEETKPGREDDQLLM